MNAEQILEMLKQGNQRFVTDERTYLRQDQPRVAEIADGQNPLATILCCSDSRVSPEHIFDVGLGDLFTVRTAGNRCYDMGLGSIEYGIGFLETPLMIMMGHTRCGAITAAVQGVQGEGFISTVIESVSKPVEMIRRSNPDSSEEDIIKKSVLLNIMQGIEQLICESELISERIKHNKLRVEAAIYQVETGQVDFLGEHPKQDAFL